MLSALKQRKPWVSAIITLLLGPSISMLYLNRWKLALAYFVAYLMALPFVVILLHVGVISLPISSAAQAIMWLFQIAGAFHAFKIATQFDPLKPLFWYARWYGILSILIVVFVVLFAIRLFLYEPFHVPAASMSPTLNEGDYFYVRKFAVEPKRGDVIVYKHPKNQSIEYVKRLVGMPGDIIQMKDGVPHINDKPLQHQLKDSAEGVSVISEIIPNSVSYYILNDTAYTDVDFTPAYEIPAGHYFVLGDNRDKSLDSRHMQQHGFVPAQYVTGIAIATFWNFEANRIQYQSLVPSASAP